VSWDFGRIFLEFPTREVVDLHCGLWDDEPFAVGQRLDLNKELEGSMGVFKGTEKHDVIIEFDAPRVRAA